LIFFVFRKKSSKGKDGKLKKDEFKINLFFDENGPTFEEIVIHVFEKN